ncbi:hypothetical protein HDA32_005975 [Spinactinospora alkalitolerans]|uniref:DUF1468 domain-containing protein n=1 Tax=Spinactinospora alkalitolerans TaxID=687207 RepID=A0A852U5K2_9ACTN|nr:tripartite tricarboxylate transporter TctB family protein [Spinactinospora alkalitolerans]NYE50855.1 hypothetical protein [Spinactinospora alkalitolerans]
MAKTSATWVRIPFQRTAPEDRDAGGAAGGGRAAGARPRVSGATVFYLVLALVLGAYTVMAFGMEWRTAAGRVGPGFFPRVLGLLGLAICLLAAVGSALPKTAARTPAEAERRHPWTVVAVCLALAAFVTVLVPVGAVVTGSLFLIAVLMLCDRGHPVRAVVLGAVFPAALYAVFVLWLNAPLPSGLLPLF